MEALEKALEKTIKNIEERRQKKQNGPKGKIHISKRGNVSIDQKQLFKSESFQNRIKSMAEAEKNFRFKK